MTDTLRRPARDTSGTDTKENRKKPDMDTIIAEHGDRIFRLCLLYLGNRSLAEDAFQETMVKCWQHYDTYREDAPFVAWLKKIAIRVCYDTMRKGWFRIWKKSDNVEKLYDIAAENTPHDTEVREAVAALPGMYREVIVLHYYENLSTSEIAEVLAIPKGTVTTRLKKARSIMKKRLEDEDSHA